MDIHEIIFDREGGDVNVTLVGVGNVTADSVSLLVTMEPENDDEEEIESRLLHYNRKTKEVSVLVEFQDWFTALTEDQQGILYASSASGEFVTLKNNKAVTKDLNCPDGLNALRMLPEGGYVLVGNEGMLVQLEPGKKTPVSYNFGSDLYDLSVFSQTAMVAVGDKGGILYGNGTTWEKIKARTTACMYAVWMVNETFYYVGGERKLLQIKPDKINSMKIPDGVTVYSMVVFQDQLYIATGEDGIYMVETSGEYKQVADDYMFTLQTAGGFLFGFGNEMMIQYDGTEWEKTRVLFQST